MAQKTRIMPNIQALAPYVPGLSIDEIRDRYHLSQVIKLASNENPLGASPLAVEATKRHAASIFRYPQGGNPLLRATLAGRHGVPEEKIAVGNGSDEIIDLLIRILARPGRDNILCFQPCFSIYPIQAAINNIEARSVPLEKDFSFNFDRLLELADENTKLVFITTPDNPSGYCSPVEDVARLACGLAKKAPNALLVIDEAYMDFCGDEKAYSLLARESLAHNVAVLRTLSKSWGLAGLRLGYAVLPEDIADGFWRARLPFSVNILAEKAALAALQDRCFRQATLETVARGRQYLSHELKGMDCQVWPSHANFIMFGLPGDTEKGAGAKALFEFLLARGVIIRPLASYGLPHLLRVSVGNDSENRQFIDAARQFLTGTKP